MIQPNKLTNPERCNAMKSVNYKEYLKNKEQYKFVYSNYWGTWSRILCYDQGFIELNLTPVNGFHKGNIEKENIRFHRTHDIKDKYYDQLPKEILLYMEDHLPHTFIRKLLNYDYMKELSIENVKKRMIGGGVSFHVLVEYELQQKVK